MQRDFAGVPLPLGAASSASAIFTAEIKGEFQWSPCNVSGRCSGANAESDRLYLDGQYLINALTGQVDFTGSAALRNESRVRRSRSNLVSVAVLPLVGVVSSHNESVRRVDSSCGTQFSYFLPPGTIRRSSRNHAFKLFGSLGGCNSISSVAG
jgi:hypothetical protein